VWSYFDSLWLFVFVASSRDTSVFLLVPPLAYWRNFWNPRKNCWKPLESLMENRCK
jgi:hypothetical protein